MRLEKTKARPTIINAAASAIKPPTRRPVAARVLPDFTIWTFSTLDGAVEDAVGAVLGLAVVDAAVVDTAVVDAWDVDAAVVDASDVDDEHTMLELLAAVDVLSFNHRPAAHNGEVVVTTAPVVAWVALALPPNPMNAVIPISTALAPMRALPITDVAVLERCLRWLLFMVDPL